GNSVFFLLHVILAYAGAQGIGSLLAATHLPVGAALIGLAVVLLVVGAGGWLLIRRRARRAGAPAPPLAEVGAAWADACCPACLALGAIGQLRDRPSVAAAE
ncbi:MAG TPA: hypothetical protein VKY74_24260, partial [Chloroflexia bacterium]|nr:hypothetical protein [Chloroflexia bacterium]